MGSREPLAGWQWEYDTSQVRIGPLFLVAYPDGDYSVSVEDVFGYGGDGVVSARIAAEDAARALVAEMAAALGGSVTWADAQEDEAILDAFRKRYDGALRGMAAHPVGDAQEVSE